MEPGFTISDLHHFVAIKLVFFIFVAGAIFLWYRFRKPEAFLAWAGAMAGLGYFLFVDNLALPFWGLRGDEVTIAAMFEAFAHGGFFRDFGYAHLPPFYPPLYFWLFALIGKIVDWNGIQMSKFASFTCITVFPLFCYFLQRAFFHTKQTVLHKQIFPEKIGMMLMPFILWLFIDWDAMILKPYEVMLAVASLVWMGSLIPLVLNSGLKTKTYIVYAISGGLIFMSYYLWLIFAYLGAFLYALTVSKKDQWRFYGQLFIVGVGLLVISLPYLIPLIASYRQFGSENWQVALLLREGIATDMPMFQLFSWRGMFMLGGFVSMLWYARTNMFIRILFACFLASYVWQIMGLATVLFFDAPIQESKGFYFFNRAILAFTAAYALEKGWYWMKEKYVVKVPALPSIIAVIGILFLGTNMIFGTFADDPVAQAERKIARSLRHTIPELVDFLKQDSKQQDSIVTFHAGIAELAAYLPINSFIYFNQHNSHPAAEFTARKTYTDYLSLAKTPEEFYDLSKNTWFGSIDRYIFFRHEGSLSYRIYFNIDTYPNGGGEQVVEIPKRLVIEPYFTKVYENDEFVVWDRNNR